MGKIERADASDGEVRDKLLALAERCEREVPDRRGLDAEIATALGHSIEWVTANYTMELFPAIHWKKPHPYAGMKEPCPLFTSSLDAAVTLVPAGHLWMVDTNGHGTVGAMTITGFTAEVSTGDPEHGIQRGDAETAAAALCAAALRARAFLSKSGA